jgi:tyrosyl-tRNA synthetase
MEPAVRKSNMAEMHMQLKKLWVTVERHVSKWGYEREDSWRRGLFNNNTWWNKKPLYEVMRDLGSGVRIGPMLGRDKYVAPGIALTLELWLTVAPSLS